MSDTSKKLFSHRGFWKEDSQQNTTEAIIAAFSSGFDVEVDLRVNSSNELVVGHDIAQEIRWEEVLSCPKRKMIAFHVKEKGLANKIWDLIGDMDYLEYVIFGVSEEEMALYVGLFGYDSIAFEYNAGDDFSTVYESKNKIIWIAELDGKKVSKKELILLKSLDKIIYVVTQDCHAGDMLLFGIRINMYAEGFIDGICTDNPNVIKHYVK